MIDEKISHAIASFAVELEENKNVESLETWLSTAGLSDVERDLFYRLVSRILIGVLCLDPGLQAVILAVGVSDGMLAEQNLRQIHQKLHSTIGK